MAIIVVRAPIPGIFYDKPAPDQPPFKTEGDSVAPGDSLALVEVMKTFNPVKSSKNGRFVRYLVENEDELMAGQPIAEIDVD
ncbi:acetyl-CoA carboxylase [Telmatospirillum siberiense]|uniref:Biotin carboxyl carrier protein of acetyl-CoA carboxylase n=1 Tax=Telmatospirillum siberiense TaxID=382514 RepID=A0A2N3PR35_9PROT|nr:acetyl-CoA carboxylase [Telmatospirillum siberiense]PKU22856.1 biotin carboxyl carrier domain-containing protein [Telmatospirillum siberiense]